MIQIPITDSAHAEFSIVLDGKNCVLRQRQLGARLFLSLTVDQTVVFENQLCVDRQFMPVFETQLFSGKLRWVDSLGNNHPVHPGLGTRYQLHYYTEDEVDGVNNLL